MHRWHEKTHFLHNKSGGEIAEEPGDDHENVNKQALKLLKKNRKKLVFYYFSRRDSHRAAVVYRGVKERETALIID